MEKSGRLKTSVVVALEAGFLHLELGHHIHQDHNERMQKTILQLECAKMIELTAISKRWLMCKLGGGGVALQPTCCGLQSP